MKFEGFNKYFSEVWCKASDAESDNQNALSTKLYSREWNKIPSLNYHNFEIHRCSCSYV